MKLNEFGYFFLEISPVLLGFCLVLPGFNLVLPSFT